MGARYERIEAYAVASTLRGQEIETTLLQPAFPCAQTHFNNFSESVFIPHMVNVFATSERAIIKIWVDLEISKICKSHVTLVYLLNICLRY